MVEHAKDSMLVAALSRILQQAEGVSALSIVDSILLLLVHTLGLDGVLTRVHEVQRALNVNDESMKLEFGASPEPLPPIKEKE